MTANENAEDGSLKIHRQSITLQKNQAGNHRRSFISYLSPFKKARRLMLKPINKLGGTTIISYHKVDPSKQLSPTHDHPRQDKAKQHKRKKKLVSWSLSPATAARVTSSATGR